MRLVERERLERLEYDELTRSPSASALFNKDETAALPARRAREQFQKIFVPGFTLALMLAEAAGAFSLALAEQSHCANRETDALRSSSSALSRSVLRAGTILRLDCADGETTFTGTGCRVVLAGAYFALSPRSRPLWLIWGYPPADLYIARALVILLGLLAAGNFFRAPAGNLSPAYERQARYACFTHSRLVSLLAQPESFFTTAAHALDYQFGFKVSETWFFHFFNAPSRGSSSAS